MKARTKEEKFLLALHELAKEEEMDRYIVGQHVGIHPKGVDTICNQLAQANFIKKRGTKEIILTSNGLTLVHELQEVF